VEKLRPFGVPLDPKTQAPIHLIAFAALQGVCCLGPERENGESTYVLLDDWISPERSSGSRAGELAARYFRAFGPATPEDFASWSGMPMPVARSAVNEALPELEQTTVEGQPAFLPRRTLASSDRPRRRSLRLLPAFDTYLLGYRSRDLAVEKTLRRRLQRGGGWLHPAIVVDGRAMGAWRLKMTGVHTRIAIEHTQTFRSTLRHQLEAEIRDVGRFLGREIH
jgi:winged helix DNA-binding protein